MSEQISTFNLNSAFETAKYAKYANGPRLCELGPLTHWVKRFSFCGRPCQPSISRGSRGSRFIPTAVSRFKELQVYQLACLLDEAIFRETKRWPSDEKFALIDQIRRSSRAIGANLAEGWAKRRYPAHFVRP